MSILEAIQKGKTICTKSGFQATFVALLPADIPARVLMEVNDDLESYYIDGKLNSPIISNMDLIINGL